MAEGSMIPAAPESDLLSVLNNKGDRASTLFDILDNLHQITQSLLAENRMAKIPMQTEAALKQLNQTLTEATLTLRELRGQATNNNESKLAGVVTKLDRILGKIEKGEGSLGALINDSAVHDRLKNLLGTQDAAHQTRSLLRTSIKHQEDRSQ
jgi:phospholipid/cholesterol/gamma-HCH transport system substrate-binding protein